MVTSSSSGRRRRSSRCTGRRSIFVIGWGATSPGSGAGEARPNLVPPHRGRPASANETVQRRGHRYSGDRQSEGTPSMISIDGASITLTTLKRDGGVDVFWV